LALVVRIGEYGTLIPLRPFHGDLSGRPGTSFVNDSFL